MDAPEGNDRRLTAKQRAVYVAIVRLVDAGTLHCDDDLVSATGLSRVAVCRISKELVSRGLVTKRVRRGAEYKVIRRLECTEQRSEANRG